MPKLTTQAGGVSIGRAIGTLAGLATMMVLSRTLAPQDYGTYRQVWLVFFTLAPILELGVPPSVSFFGPQIAGDQRKTYLAQNGLALVVSGALLALALVSFAAPVARLFRNPDLIAPLRAFAIFPAFTLSFDLVENALVSMGRAGTSGVVTAASAILQAAVTLLAFGSGASLARVFLFISLWAALRWMISVATLLHVYRGLRVRWNARQLRDQLAFALPMGAATMVGLLARQADKIIVSSHFSPETFAVYANGAYDIPLINIVTMSVTAVLVPAMVRARCDGQPGEVRRLWHGAARRVATILFPAFCLLFVAARPFVVFLFSPAYAESAAPFRVLLFMLPLRIVFHGGFLRALGRTGPIFFSSAGAFVLGVALALVLVRVEALGLLGAALASLAAAYWAAIYAMRVACRTLGWSWREYFPWRALGGVMAISLAAAAPTAAVGWAMRDAVAWQQLALMGAVYGASYLALGQLTGAARLREWRQAVTDVLKQR
jgi:O-antigen/teichoic acid export membrane protein